MGAVSFEIAGLKSSLAHDRLPFFLLLRPLVGLPSIFAVLQQLGPCLTRPCGNNPARAKNPPSNKAGYITQSHATCQTFSQDGY
jgi:hypothetical protein